MADGLCILTTFAIYIRYSLSLTRMNAYRYSYQCYRMLTDLDNVDRVTWATKIRNNFICMCSVIYGFMRMLETMYYLLNILRKC